MRSRIGEIWQGRRTYQTVALVTGAVLILSGLFHLGVFFVRGGAWEGPISWRKPVTFGLSFGLTTATIGWLAGYLRHSLLLALSVWTMAVTAAVEVFLVAMQQWRGVPSHFNDATNFDTSVFGVMGLTISLTSLGILFIVFKSFREVIADSAMKLALRTGLGLLVAALVRLLAGLRASWA